MENMIYGCDINKFTANEILEKTGISSFEDEQLLEAFLECVGNIEFAHINETNEAREKTYLSSAPIAYEAYRRFYCSGERTINLKNISLKIEHLPDSLYFWTYPAAINLLNVQMIKDGFYKLTNQTSGDK